MSGSYECGCRGLRKAARRKAGLLVTNERRTAMTLDTLQLGEPVEHRGIVVTPLFPRRDPVTAYITLDEALPRGLRITETSDSGSVPELFVENPTESAVLLYDG